MGSKPVTINIPTAKVKISPLGFFRYGSEFLMAALSFNKTPNKFSPVPYYLYSRSIELLLKAFLLSKNDSIERIKEKIGHNLEKALNRTKLMGINSVVAISLEEENEILKANNYYKSKGFEYFELKNAMLGYPDLPDLDILRELASKLVEKLEHICLNA